VSDGRMLYVPGAVWHRIDASEFKCERLNGMPLPSEQRFQRYAVSAHYGLVAWCKQGDNYDDRRPPDRLFRVIVDENGPDPRKQ